MRAAIAILLSLLVSGCTSIQKQKAQAPKPDDLHFHNLQVFPQNIPREELIEQMKGFTRALGVRCEHCHVQTAQTPKPAFDFASDEKPQKAAARIMIRMTNDINARYVSKIEEMYTTVSCWTCHRGARRPDVQPAAAPQPGK
jgi:thioredoxin reductase